MESTSPSLLDRLRQPDSEPAWARFHDLYVPLLYHWARRLGLQPADAADLVQDVLAGLVRALPQFTYDPSRSFRAWLRTVLLNRWRTGCRRAAPPHEGGSALDEVAGPDPLEELAEAEYRQHLIRETLRALRPEFSATMWKAFEGHVLAGRPAGEVAAELNVPAGTVYVAKSRVLKRLRQELAGLLD
jgi:RNA polymerase sigma-70 factor (ECF subfamily)